jgi:hypothetical protein
MWNQPVEPVLLRTVARGRSLRTVEIVTVTFSPAAHRPLWLNRTAVNSPSWCGCEHTTVIVGVRMPGTAAPAGELLVRRSAVAVAAVDANATQPRRTR